MERLNTKQREVRDGFQHRRDGKDKRRSGNSEDISEIENGVGKGHMTVQ